KWIAIDIWKDFYVECVWNRGEQMDGDLRLFVMCHLDVGHAGHSGDATPFGDAAGDGGVDIEDVNRTGIHEVAATEARDLALAGIDGNAAGVLADQREPLQLVVPLDWFFKPANVLVVNEAAELDGFVRGPTLVRVAGDQEVIADGFSGNVH